VNNLIHTLLALVTVGLGHGVYRKLYTLIGGQRAEKFENHWSSGWAQVRYQQPKMTKNRPYLWRYSQKKAKPNFFHCRLEDLPSLLRV